MEDDGFEWLRDAMLKASDIRYGSLPPSINLSIGQMRNKIGDYIKADLEEYNEAEGHQYWTKCESPFHILGYTKEGLIAYYGVNYVDAMTHEELVSAITSFINEGDAELRATGKVLQNELSDLLSTKN